MKALTIYPRTDLERVAMEANVAGGRLALAGLWALPGFTGPSKRFTDAELAAEYQFSRLDSRVRFARTQNYPGNVALYDHYERGLEQEWTLERFATLPHYDEAVS